jgi:hypothetical protein
MPRAKSPPDSYSRPAVVGEVPGQELIADGLDVAVDPEVGAVDPDPRERAARRRQPGGAEQLVAER